MADLVDENREALVIDEKVVAHIRMHGVEAYPNECCGALIGSGQVVFEGFALPNKTDEGPRRRFLVTADDYRAAEKHATDIGKEVIGFYHSHPAHPARPSQYDLDHAGPSFAYVIVAVEQGESKEMTSWRLREDRSMFDREPITVDSSIDLY